MSDMLQLVVQDSLPFPLSQTTTKSREEPGVRGAVLGPFASADSTWPPH